MQRHRVVALVVTELGLIAREDRGLFGRVWERLTNCIVEEAAQQVAYAAVAGVCTCAVARVRELRLRSKLRTPLLPVSARAQSLVCELT